MSLTPAAAQTLRHALATAVVVPVTPLRADGNPDWDTYAALTGRLIDGGIKVITPNGNTGESRRPRPGRRSRRPRRSVAAGRKSWRASATTSRPPPRRPGTPGTTAPA